MSTKESIESSSSAGDSKPPGDRESTSHRDLAVDALVLAGGMGRRFVADGKSPSQGSLPKQFRMLGDIPVFVHSLRSLAALNCIRHIILVVPTGYMSFAQEMVAQFLGKKFPVHVVEGGDQRQDSSRIGLEMIESLGSLPARVLIHDACRPFLSADFLDRIRTHLLDRSYGAWVPVVPVIDTLKRVENHQVVETVDRSSVHRVQTPQIFEYSVVRSLIEKTKELKDLNFTDDASLCEYYGIPVGVFEGDVRNIKLTYDFELQTLGTMLTNNQVPPCEPESVTTSIV